MSQTAISIPFQDDFSMTICEEIRFSYTTKGTSEYILGKFHLEWDTTKLDVQSEVLLQWKTPMNQFLYRFHPAIRNNRYVPPSWGGWIQTMTSVSCPLLSFHDGEGINKYTFYLSEASSSVYYKAGTEEYTGNLICQVRIPLKPFISMQIYEFELVIDKRERPLETILNDAREYYENIGLVPMKAPTKAFLPLYSFWYSHHHDLSDKLVEEEAKRAKELGMDTIIVDDGWQENEGCPGFMGSGTWKPDLSKFPNMKEHVARIHALHMNYVLWHSLSFLGEASPAYLKYKDKMLRYVPHLKAHVIDVRYKEMRDYLINTLSHNVEAWELDGLKLDFIDLWEELPENAPYNEQMDIPILSVAVDTLMKDLRRKLLQINPDILIEFRQRYIGPCMRQYGNLFRVADCPNDAYTNRTGLLDLRQLLGDSAVHSDMMMWHPEEDPTCCATQLLASFFGTLQFSMKIQELTEVQRKIVQFWIHFYKEHVDLLQKQPIHTKNPEIGYSYAWTESASECAVAVYIPHQVLSLPQKSTLYIANASSDQALYFNVPQNYSYMIQNTLGEIITRGALSQASLTTLDVPIGGLLTLTA